MSDVEPIVYIVDDDEDVRNGLKNLLQSVGLKAEIFESPSDFMRFDRTEAPSCVVLDVRFCGQERSGLEFQRELLLQDVRVPIIFITGHGDVRMSVQAMKHGAIEFLTKPVREQELLDAVRTGIERDRHRLEKEQSLASIREHFDSLTMREREVFALVVAGQLNKQIAGVLGLSEVTVKVHRGQVMRKMGARSLAELVRMSDRLSVPAATNAGGEGP